MFGNLRRQSGWFSFSLLMFGNIIQMFQITNEGIKRLLAHHERLISLGFLEHFLEIIFEFFNLIHCNIEIRVIWSWLFIFINVLGNIIKGFEKGIIGNITELLLGICSIRIFIWFDLRDEFEFWWRVYFLNIFAFSGNFYWILTSWKLHL